MQINYKLIGKRIQEIRKREGLSQMALAEAAGLSCSYISYIETGKKQPSLTALLQIVNTLGITMDELLLGNQFSNSTDYQTDFDVLMEDCTLSERRFLYLLSVLAKKAIRDNDWVLMEKNVLETSGDFTCGQPFDPRFIDNFPKNDKIQENNCTPGKPSFTEGMQGRKGGI